MTRLLEISNVKISFESGLGCVDAVRGISLSMDQGDAIALVGASGSGKTVLGRSLLGLVDAPGVVSGSIRFDGSEIVGASERQLQKIRGLGIGMVFQDALDGLNPVYSIGSQLAEICRVRLGYSASQAAAHAIKLMEQVGIRNASERFNDYPHQFSGGMRQRICIAMAIGMKPKILIADEPTTALDVTVQAGILRLIKSLQAETKMGLIFVTHDLAVARTISTRIVVMYSGQIVEEGPTEEIFRNPKHPYTKALLAAHPGRVRSWRDLQPLPEAFVTDPSAGHASGQASTTATAVAT
ncbi:ABC transporter ATP-binding protein [Comamonas testosteroni]|uniref:ABC transporter ATP-binding protein n=1 Tax=Comamonas testosteroni TaxID=285 RepID=UPI002DB8648C|nr:ABC transporter ATP-binding protein [Comamonas testosteroni]MEB5967386.1 ABC transporter ATP-binding protein [Comamonas testosteroni]